MESDAADHPPAVYAPQGLFGWGVHELKAGEVWAQSYELGYLSGQAGLGKGWDVTLGDVPLPDAHGFTNYSAAEVGWSRPHGDWTFRASILAAGALRLYDAGRETEVAAMGLGAGVAAAWGPRERHVALNLHVLDLPSLEGAGAFFTADGVWTLSPHWAALGGLTYSVIANELVTLQAGSLGGGGRLVLGRFSLDLGLQLGVGGSDAPCLPDAVDCAQTSFLPVPTLAIRYGFGG